MFALSDVELGVVGKAFDRAWDSFLRTGRLTPKNLSDTRTMLAARILRAAYYGERDEWRLARDAVTYLKQVIEAPPPNPRKDAERTAFRRKIVPAKLKVPPRQAAPEILSAAQP